MNPPPRTSSARPPRRKKRGNNCSEICSIAPLGGSPALLVQQTLSTRKASRQELAEICEILNRYERGIE